MLLARMEQDGDGSTFSHLALHLYMTVMQIHQLLGEIHTDTCSRRIEVVQLVVAGEALKEHTAFLRRDTDTFVLYGQCHKAGLRIHNHADILSGRGELKGITEQIPQDRIHTSAIDPYRRVLRLALHREMDMLVIRLFLEIRAGLIHQFAQQRGLHFEFHLLVLHLAELQ